MGSVGNYYQNHPWQTNNYKNCSQIKICSIYCPQWCYLIFPSPLPFSPTEGGGSDGGSGSTDIYSPLIILAIIILTIAFVLLSYYTIISKYWRSRSTTSQGGGGGAPATTGGGGGGLDESIIKSITVWSYKKSISDGCSGSDCAVCLTEFEENERLRLLPKCNHVFHVSCIDAWLKSNPSCPLCRANIIASSAQPLPPSVNQETLPLPEATAYANV